MIDYSGQSYFFGPAQLGQTDREKFKQNAELRAPIYRFLDSVLTNADKFVIENDEAARSCAITWLNAWAHANAFLGRVEGQGRYERQWTLATAALAYIKLGKADSDAIHQRIGRWMHSVSRSVIEFDSGERHFNNHHYYAGLAVGATAIAFSNDALWAYARSNYTRGVSDIRDDGALPLELERGPRASAYHQLAAGPLVVLARLSRLRGEDLFSYRDGRIHRLVALSAKAHRDRGIVERMTGIKQSGVRAIPWWPLYASAFPRQAAELPDPRTFDQDRHLGGSIAVLDRVLPLKRAR